MTQSLFYLDPPPHSRRSRKISIVPNRWFVEVVLDREGYVDSHHSGFIDTDHDASETDLSSAFVAALSKLRPACHDRIWLSGYRGTFGYSSSSTKVHLAVPYGYDGQAVTALKAAELDADMSGLEALWLELTLPTDEWLAPGERYLRRGVDFDASPRNLLSMLREKARTVGVKLNGRADPGGVWVDPKLSPSGRFDREAFSEQFARQPDPSSIPAPTSGLRRPAAERSRNRARLSTGEPVTFHRSAAEVARKCACGKRFYRGDGDANRHEAHHLRWSLGVRVPGTIEWGAGDVAVVTTQSATRWRQLVAQVATVPMRENGYDFSSWSAGDRPEPSPEHLRAYLLRFQDWVIGYMLAADRREHQRDDFERGVDPRVDDTLRASIEMIWIAASHRRQGLGRRLVEQLVQDSDVALADLSWSWPLSDNGGEHLAHSVQPEGVWVHR